MNDAKSLTELKEIVRKVVEERAPDIAEISASIMENPESGFREEKTASRVVEELTKLGADPVAGLAVTGVKGTLRGRAEGPTVGIFGELDSLIIPEHPYADPTTGAAHACGHNAQVASMIGAGMALREVMPYLDGNVALIGVPAEECIEVDWRLNLRERGDIEFLVGKAEMLRIGALDEIDMAMLTHTAHNEEWLASLGDSHNGCVVKRATYHGLAAHAGAYPWAGINALKAAMLGMAAIDAQRETFKDSDTVRVHPIVTHGGDAVSAVPSEASVEMLVRARSFAAITDASAKVDRALKAGALAIGATVDIETVSGYFPHTQDPLLSQVVRNNCQQVVGADRVGTGQHVAGSTDMGDLSFVMPVVHPRCAGTTGKPHSKTYWVNDHNKAAVLPAMWMALSVVDLLWDGAKEAKHILGVPSNRMSRKEYVDMRRSLDRQESFGELTAPVA